MLTLHKALGSIPSTREKEGKKGGREGRRKEGRKEGSTSKEHTALISFSNKRIHSCLEK
jgi:hypothetical protein